MTINKLTKLIEKNQEHIIDVPRDYIGASIIGSDCLRQIWYEFKGVKSEGVPPKTRRTWAIGKHLEGLVLEWLELAGVELDKAWLDLQGNKMPYFKGHVDSVWIKGGKPFAIIEIKTAKDSSFKIFATKGVEAWNPQYYAQIQSYMGMSGIFNAYILVLNKDNSDISDELVTFDADFYEKLCNKARMIAEASIQPPRISNTPLWFKCKLCKFNKECHA